MMTETEFLIKLYRHYMDGFTQSAFFSTYARVAAEAGVLGFNEPGISTKIKYRLKVCTLHKIPANNDVNLRARVFRSLCMEAIRKIDYWQRTGEWAL